MTWQHSHCAFGSTRYLTKPPKPEIQIKVSLHLSQLHWVLVGRAAPPKDASAPVDMQLSTSEPEAHLANKRGSRKSLGGNALRILSAAAEVSMLSKLLNAWTDAYG